jgi:hypothetical protein
VRLLWVAVKCPNGCSGHGQCMSMRDAAEERDGWGLFREVQYSTPWDADMIRGCACDVGWDGFDCSQRTCPRGDDPLTMGQQDEVQVINCTCPHDECVGYLVLSFYGQKTQRINASAVLSITDESTASTALGLAVGESLESKLEGIRVLDGVEITNNGTTYTAWHGKAPVCAPGTQGGAITRIRFNEHGGDVPTLGVASFVYGNNTSTGELTAAVVTIMSDGEGSSIRGTTEHAECSNRGICNRLTGDCLCFANYFASDGDGGSGTRPDCGYASLNVTDCPNSIDRCSNRGVCDSQRVINGSLFVVDAFTAYQNETFLYKCSCHQGFTGGDCSLRESCIDVMTTMMMTDVPSQSCVRRTTPGLTRRLRTIGLIERWSARTWASVTDRTGCAHVARGLRARLARG